MLCDHCGKREATVHIQKIVNGKVEFKHYCSECTEKLSGTDDFDGMDLMGILSNLSGKIRSAAGKGMPPDLKNGIRLDFVEEAAKAVPEIVCPVCGTKWAQVHKSGQCMCPSCYDAFEEPLRELLAEHHEGLTHTGSVPQNVQYNSELHEKRSLLKRLDELQKEMAFMVEKEEYEIAAKLRDEVNALRAKLSAEEPDHDK